MNALIPSQVAEATLPAVYEIAKKALAECETIDECKGWSDKAAALASYAKQASDETLEQKARAIRNRAIRRMGQVLEQVEPATGKAKKDGAVPLSRQAAARDAGISERQQKTALRVASIPEDEFEAATKHADRQPTVTALADRGTKKRVVIDHTGGRDPATFNKCMHFVADLTRAAKELRGRNSLLSSLTQTEMAEAKAAAEILREIAEDIEVY